MKISQREARRNQRELAQLQIQLEDQRAQWGRSYPGGTNIAQVNIGVGTMLGRLESAQMLRHAIVAVPHSDGVVYFYALPLPEVIL